MRDFMALAVEVLLVVLGWAEDSLPVVGALVAVALGEVEEEVQGIFTRTTLVQIKIWAVIVAMAEVTALHNWISSQRNKSWFEM